MGGMTFNLKDSEMTGVAHSIANDHETTEILSFCVLIKHLV